MLSTRCAFFILHGMHAAPYPARFLILPVLALGLAGRVSAADLRFANGAPIRGEVKAVSAEGMEIQSGANSKLYPWTALSPGTRFRYDPVYRVNLDAIQRGLPPSARTNEPDSGYLTTPAEEGASAEEQTAVPVAPVDLEHYEGLRPLPRGKIPSLDLQHPEAAISWGMRYGLSAADVVYFVFDVKDPGELPESLTIYNPAKDTTDRIKAARRTDGADTLAQFRKLRYEGAFDDAKVGMNVACHFSSRNPAALLVMAEVELTRGSQFCSFLLQGAPAGGVLGDGDIRAAQLLAPPTLWMTTEISDGKPVAVGAIRMGRLKLIPQKGMDEALHLTIADESGAMVMDESVAVVPTNPQERNTISVPLGKLTPGRKYALKASIDLGPLLGRLRYEESLVVPEIGTR